MRKTAEKLMAYRRSAVEDVQPASNSGEPSSETQPWTRTFPSMTYYRFHQNVCDGQSSHGTWQWLNIDVLDAPPFCTWRKFYESNPRRTLVVTFSFYVAGQLLFIWAQFGLVFFAVSVLLTICLSLGNRSEGEMSAYSVFNPNCERLLGQMTAEHFERDVLRRRID
ncbi:hypothetical protein KIN20_002321 [Parelaphostrongylus tenuis]|uniref:SAYSvFN domain-containing protein n=1 Tax=Parelaphostrongylus tenuis TaxID=148309 RepID=A0AAD5LVH0_PARTN|nr:hypothetical protein KIN20_002321 [Parelaphostrongylus tenuis]